MFRWLSHTHDLVLVAETYAPPTVRLTEVSGVCEVVERFLHGCTTFVWKCSEPKCSKIVTRVVLGKKVP